MPWINFGFILTVSFIFPLSVLGWVVFRQLSLFKPFSLGVLAFTLSQVLLRIPLLQYGLSPQVWFIAFSYAYPILFLFLLSLSAGVFEEVARFLMMKYGLRGLSRKDALFFGLGHGGLEALLFVGLPVVMNAQQFMGPEAWLAGVERISAMLIHCALSILVYQSLKETVWYKLGLAILIHTLFNFMAIYLIRQGVAIWIVEGVLISFAMGLSFIMIKERRYA